MKVYHMSDTLRLGDTMSPDYKRYMELAEPFVQALGRSEDCFYGMFLNGKYLRAVLGKFALKDMGSDYVKWSVEGAFEYIRRTEFPESYSRLRCNYFYDNLPDIIRLYEVDWGSADEAERMAIRLFEIELDDDAPQKRDMLLFDRAYDAMWDSEDLKTVLDCARSYFAGGCTESPVWELLSDKPAEAVRDITDHIHG